jgi:hypothetical protein
MPKVPVAQSSLHEYLFAQENSLDDEITRLRRSPHVSDRKNDRYISEALGKYHACMHLKLQPRIDEHLLLEVSSDLNKHPPENEQEVADYPAEFIRGVNLVLDACRDRITN